MTDEAQISTGTLTDTTSTTDTTTTTSTDSTAENVAVNDPEKNKKLAEITMSERLRDNYNLTFRIPKLLKGIHTNQFLFIELDDSFYEKNYPEIVEAIADKKFARYAGFQKGRFFIEKVKMYGGVDGFGTEVTVNPLASSLGTYAQAQYEAEKALIQAINEANSNSSSTGTSSGSSGLTSMSGDDCSETFNISTRSYDISSTANNKIGNSSANYATDTSSMDGKTALLDIYNRFSYSSYSNNRTCPQKMWNKSGTIRGNCADISRLCMCVGQVHGMTIGIHHMSGHYYNLVEVNGTTYRFDCCCQSSGSYRGEVTNTLTKRGGPWA